MRSPLVPIAPPSVVYRISRRLRIPFAPPPWGLALTDGTFGNRFDDPSAKDGRTDAERFRAIYCASDRAGAFGESVARFRLALPMLAALGEVEDDEPLDDFIARVTDPADRRRGIIPADWRLHRQIGDARLDPALRFVDVSAAESVQHLR